MQRNAAQLLVLIQETAARDPEYLALLEEYRQFSGRLSELMERLPREDADVVEDYLGVAGELHRRQLIIACELE